MALIRLDPYTKGEVIKLYNYGEPVLGLSVRAPDGMIILIPAPRGVVELWLPQVGTWIYRWGDREEMRLEVVELPSDVSKAEVDVGLSFIPAIQMQVTRRPRF